MNDLFFITCKATKRWVGDAMHGARCFVELDHTTYRPGVARVRLQPASVVARPRHQASWWLDLDTAVTHYQAFRAQLENLYAERNFEQIEIWKFRSRAGVSEAEAAPEVVWPVKAEPAIPDIAANVWGLSYKSNNQAQRVPTSQSGEPASPDTKYTIVADLKREDGSLERWTHVPLATAVERVRATKPFETLVTPSRELVGADFADYGNRALLAELGYFSVDLKPHRAKREREALIKRYLEEAYDVVGLDRNEQHEIIAAKLEATKTDGVWAKSTGEYAQACRRLDNFMLRNSPATEQSVRDLENENVA